MYYYNMHTHKYNIIHYTIYTTIVCIHCIVVNVLFCTVWLTNYICNAYYASTCITNYSIVSIYYVITTIDYSRGDFIYSITGEYSGSTTNVAKNLR